MGKLYDKTGREILLGDVVKVFHFVHYRRQRHCYMHKHVVGEGQWRDGAEWFRLSHLDGSDKGYFEARDGRRLCTYEIVQGAHDDFYERQQVPA